MVRFGYSIHYFIGYVLGLTFLCHLLNLSYATKNPSFDQNKFIVSLMVKEESDILDHWINYHSIIFGNENILINDNNSENPKTVEILKNWQRKGVHVYYNQGPYGKKGEICLKNARLVSPNATVIFPVDADEFLVAYKKKISYIDEKTKIESFVPVVNLTMIYDELNSFLMNKEVSTLGLTFYPTSMFQYANDSIETVVYYRSMVYPDAACKKIFKLPKLLELNHGNHNGKMSSGDYQSSNALGLFHYHFRNPIVTVLRAIEDAKGFDYLPINTTLDTLPIYHEHIKDILKNHPDSPGNHKLHQLAGYLNKKEFVKLEYSVTNTRFLPIAEILQQIQEQKKLWDLQ